MLERQYRLDPWLTLVAMIVPVVASLPFLHASPWTQADASLIISVKTLGLMWAPGYPVYLLATRALAWLLPLGPWAARVQLIQALYLALLSGMIFRLGRALLFPPLACLSTSLSLVLTIWIWPDVLLPAPLTLHLCLLFLFLRVTLSRLTSPAGRYIRAGLFIWGALGGLTGGQEWFLWAWVVPALVLGAWLAPGKRAWRLSYWVALGSGVLFGAVLPYGYLLNRIFSAHAFINADLVPQLGAWRMPLPWICCKTGWTSISVSRTFGCLPWGRWSGGVLPILGSLPFLTLCCWLLGAFIHLRQLLFQPMHPPASEPTQLGRMVIGGLPLLAVAGTALFFSRLAGTLPLAWIIAGTLWGFSGFNYLYEELGRPANLTAKPSISPTAFAVLVLVLVPLFSWVQTYPRLQALSHQAQEAATPLVQTRAFLQTLPPHALLVFPRHSESDLPAYLQNLEGLRPDVRLQALSEVWPSKPYTGHTVLELLGSTPEARQRRRLIFAEYWNQALRAELAAGQPAYLLATPLPPDPILDEFFRTFKLTWLRNLPARISHEQPQLRSEAIFSLSPRGGPEPAARPEGRAQGIFDRSLRLLKAEGVSADDRSKQACLSCRLLWEPWPDHKPQNYVLDFHLVALAPGNPAPRPVSGPWHLGRRPLIQASDPGAELPDCFWETYQFFLPRALPAGSYRLYAALWDAGAREWVPAARTQEASGYGVVVGEFSAEAARP